jgi:hypothetical protein
MVVLCKQVAGNSAAKILTSWSGSGAFLDINNLL